MESNSIVQAIVTQANRPGENSTTWIMQDPNNATIIQEAYARLGIDSATLTKRQWDSAIYSMNSVLAVWLNSGIRQWLIQERLLSLVPGKTHYDLLDVLDRPYVREIFSIKSRQVSVITAQPLTSYPIQLFNCTVAPENAIGLFTLNTSSVVTLAPLGEITCKFVEPVNIDMFGFLRNATIPDNSPAILTITCTDIGGQKASYTISNDPSQPSNFLMSMPSNSVFWIDSFMRTPITEVTFENKGAALTLNQIYITSIISQLPMTIMSRDDYMNMSRIQTTSALPSRFFVAKQAKQSIDVCPVPMNYNVPYYGTDGTITTTVNPTLQVLKIAYISANQDIGSIMNSSGVPPLFIEALTCELAARLALKEGKVDLLQILQQQSAGAYEVACAQDNEAVNITVYSDWDYE